MIDGLMKLVLDKNLEDGKLYQELRTQLKFANSIEMPWIFYERYELVPFNMVTPPGLDLSIQRISNDLYDHGWGNLPEVKEAYLAFQNQNIPSDYKGIEIQTGIESIMFPEQSDIGKKIIIDGIKYRIAKTSEETLVAARVTFNPIYNEALNEVIDNMSHHPRISRPVDFNTEISYCNIEKGLELDQSPAPVLINLGNFLGVKTPLRFLREGLKFEQPKTGSRDYNTLLEQLQN